MIQKLGPWVLPFMIVATVVAVVLTLVFSWWWLILLAVTLPLALLGIYDYLQPRHSILRNFPIVGHMRFLLEDMGPELHQYLVESDTDGRPFNRDTRSLIYERAKSVADQKPFGTELDVYAEGYTFLKHSIATRPAAEDPVASLRITVGGPQCTQPYSLSILNVSAMSFGALGGPAVRAMNFGAKKGNFAQDTGEGGISRYHREHGGDLIWQLGTGYFGCRTKDGDFDPDAFAKNASDPQVKMVEIKVSQGAKPGHGGILPGAKVTEEIAEARLVAVGETCFSPTYHKSFSTPLEMTAFITQLRELCGGKPIGFKICIGEPREFMAILKAMIQTGVYADFIVIDGGEGGTGAAPQEFSNSMGTPLLEGVAFAHNALLGAGLREHVRLGASGKMVSASAIAGALAVGADWCNSARAFMFSVGCIQAQKCHTNRCPVGVTTQNRKLQRALVVEDKAERVHGFHRNTVHALAEMVAAMGLDHPSEITPHHVVRRVSTTQVLELDDIYPTMAPGALVDGTAPERMQRWWSQCTAETFKTS